MSTTIKLYNSATGLEHFINNVESVYIAETFIEVSYRAYTPENGDCVCDVRVPLKDYPEYILFDRDNGAAVNSGQLGLIALTEKLVAEKGLNYMDAMDEAWEMLHK